MRIGKTGTPPPFLNTKDQLRLLALVGLLVLVLIAAKVTGNPAYWSWMFPPESSVSPTDNTAPQATAVDPELLKSVKDDTVGVRSSETDAYYTLLANAPIVPRDGDKSSVGQYVSFSVLMAEPDHYRGTLVRIEGELKRLTEVPSSEEKSTKIDKLYEAWLLTSDSNNTPFRIVCTNIPKEIPTGEKIEQPIRVRVVGYFFKRQGYLAKHGLHMTPLILANRLDWLKPKQIIAEDHRLAPFVASIMAVVCAVVGLIIWRTAAGNRKSSQARMKRIRETTTEDIDFSTPVDE